MQINIKATGLELSEPIKSYLESKIGQLEKLISDQAATISAEVSKTTSHHNKGDIFKTELNLKYRGGILRAEKEASDLYASIDLCKDELSEEIVRRKGKGDSLFKRGARLAKQIMRSKNI